MDDEQIEQIVSIPFIAGQWSLPERRAARNAADLAFQSPSLRGSGRFRGGRSGRAAGAAVFQSPSLRGSGRFRRAARLGGELSEGFNPLHCGAVVASTIIVTGLIAISLVSIPFIAGQWSLQPGGAPIR